MKFLQSMKIGVSLAIATMILGLGSASAQDMTNPPPSANSLPANVRQDVDLAYLLANGDPTPLNLEMFFSTLYGTPFSQSPLADLAKHRKVIAVKAFDDLYYIGFNVVGTWTLKTPDGLILWDTLDSPEEARDVLVPNMKKLGLDPETIKYIIVTHGHFDHFGGARYLQKTYPHAHILMSPADWNMILNPPHMTMARPAPRGPGAMPPPPHPAPPHHDMDITDGEVLTLGGVSVTLYITPGHTPGTVSSIIPTTFHGKKHVVEFWGGNGVQLKLEPTPVFGGLLQYRAQLYRFSKIAIADGVDSQISNHPVVDGTIEHAKIMETLKPDETSPWVLGKSTILRINAAQIAGIDAYIAYVRDKKTPTP